MKEEGEEKNTFGGRETERVRVRTSRVRITGNAVPVDTSAPLRRSARKLLRSLTSCSSFA